MPSESPSSLFVGFASIASKHPLPLFSSLTPPSSFSFLFHPTTRIISLEWKPFCGIPPPTTLGVAGCLTKVQELKLLTRGSLWTGQPASLSLFRHSVLWPNSLGFPQITRLLLACMPLHMWYASLWADFLPWLGQVLCIIQNSSLAVSCWEGLPDILVLFFTVSKYQPLHPPPPAASTHTLFPCYYCFYITNTIYNNHLGLLRPIKYDLFGLKEVTIHNDFRKSLFTSVSPTASMVLFTPQVPCKYMMRETWRYYFGCYWWSPTFTFLKIDYSLGNSHELFEDKINKLQWS